jgi:hypothetical protein
VLGGLGRKVPQLLSGSSPKRTGKHNPKPASAPILLLLANNRRWMMVVVSVRGGGEKREVVEEKNCE